jgi:hypothetical protein
MPSKLLARQEGSSILFFHLTDEIDLRSACTYGLPACARNHMLPTYTYPLLSICVMPVEQWLLCFALRLLTYSFLAERGSEFLLHQVKFLLQRHRSAIYAIAIGTPKFTQPK